MAGQLGWQPSEFWNSTFYELYYMHRGWLQSQGVDPDKDQVEISPASSADLKRLLRQSNERRTSKNGHSAGSTNSTDGAQS